MLNSKKQIETWLDNHNIKDYTINEDLTVNVKGDVVLSGIMKSNKDKLKRLNVQFNIVGGDFFCNNNLLRSLEGCPKIVVGDFNCGDNQLKSLKYAPTKVFKSFGCNDNCLTSLQYGPIFVGDNYYCKDNKINTLEYLPEKLGGDFNSFGNNQLNGFEKIHFFPQIKEEQLRMLKLNEINNHKKLLENLLVSKNNKKIKLKI